MHQTKAVQLHQIVHHSFVHQGAHLVVRKDLPWLCLHHALNIIKDTMIQRATTHIPRTPMRQAVARKRRCLDLAKPIELYVWYTCGMLSKKIH